MTAREQILAYLQANPGPTSPGALGQHIEAALGTIYESLRDMVKRGELVRDGLGVYRLPDAHALDLDAPAEKPKRHRFTPAAEPAPEPMLEDPVTDPLQWALWHDGDLLLRRGETTLVLTLDEATRLHAWMNAMRTAVQVGKVTT